MDYEIIATLGPASATAELWREMLAAGASAFRLNTSHLTLAQLEDWLEKLQAFFGTLERAVPVALDLQGSKWRLGQFAPVRLAEGEMVELVHADAVEREGVLPVPHADFFRAAEMSSGEIVLNDAKLRLKMESRGADWVKARVILGGEIVPHKGITLAATDFRAETLSEKDQAIVTATRGLGFVRYAVSYVKDAAEMAKYVQMMPGAGLIAKLERGPALEGALEIAKFAEELWVCRGDLGAEVGLRGMAEAVGRFSEKVKDCPVPVMMAGQVLEHLTEHATPTRSEVCYLYDRLQRGYRGFVLSDEAAVGKYPVESVRIAAMFQ